MSPIDVSDSQVLLIDLRDCNQLDQVTAKLARSLSGSESVQIRAEANLGAFSDVLWDWFFEHWGIKRSVYILGWKNVTKIDPVYAQKLLVAVADTFLSVVRGQCRSVSLGEVDFQSLGFQDELLDKKNFYFYSN